MENIPEKSLLIYDKPFASTGADYFGPFLVKHSKTTSQNQALTKRYGVIYTCLTKRAMHLELSGYLSIDSFILTLRCFDSKRGHVKIMKSYIQNSTNSVGAATELKQRLSILDERRIQNFQQ